MLLAEQCLWAGRSLRIGSLPKPHPRSVSIRNPCLITCVGSWQPKLSRQMWSSTVWPDYCCRTINTHITGVVKAVSAACSAWLLEARVSSCPRCMSVVKMQDISSNHFKLPLISCSLQTFWLDEEPLLSESLGEFLTLGHDWNYLLIEALQFRMRANLWRISDSRWSWMVFRRGHLLKTNGSTLWAPNWVFSKPVHVHVGWDS